MNNAVTKHRSGLQELPVAVASRMGRMGRRMIQTLWETTNTIRQNADWQTGKERETLLGPGFVQGTTRPIRLNKEGTPKPQNPGHAGSQKPGPPAAPPAAAAAGVVLLLGDCLYGFEVALSDCMGMFCTPPPAAALCARPFAGWAGGYLQGGMKPPPRGPAALFARPFAGCAGGYLRGVKLLRRKCPPPRGRCCTPGRVGPAAAAAAAVDNRAPELGARCLAASLAAAAAAMLLLLRFHLRGLGMLLCCGQLCRPGQGCGACC